MHQAVRRIGSRVGVNADTLRGWCKQADIDAGGVRALPRRPEDQQLEAEVRELKRANEILLAASSIFARELDPGPEVDREYRAPPLEWTTQGQAERRVREIQAKLHRWAGEDSGRRFRDAVNLVYDPPFLLVALYRVRGNRGARSAGVDGASAFYVEQRYGVRAFLADLRLEVETQTFRPLRVPRTDDSESGRQAASAGHRNRARPCRAGRSETGAGTHLGDGLPAVRLRV